MRPATSGGGTPGRTKALRLLGDRDGAHAADLVDHPRARAGRDDLDVLRATTPDGAARQLRLRPYGDSDPLG